MRKKRNQRPAWVSDAALIHDVHRLFIKQHGLAGWSLTKTARRIGLTKASVSVKLTLHQALKKFPRLANFPTQKAAYLHYLQLQRKRLG